MTYQLESFSDEWWSDFLLETKNLSAPAVFAKAIEPDRIAFYQRSALNVVATLCRLRTVQYGFRAYADGLLLDRDGMERVYDQPPSPGESLEAWSQRTFKDRKFGFIINAGEKFDEAFSQEVALAMAPLLRQTGIPRDGIQFTLFIGNYDKTPLGIHQDIRGESVTHFHVGPGSKVMYVWDKEDYRKLTHEGGLKHRDFNALKPYARQFKIEAGDLFFMPEGTFHIGEQDSLSIGITVWQYTHTNTDLARAMLRHAWTQVRPIDADAIVHDITSPDNGAHIDNIVPPHTVPLEYRHLTLEGLVKTAYVDWRHILFSNAGYRNPPFERQQREAFSRDDEVQLDMPYKILTRRIDGTGKLIVYVRGHRLEVNDHPCLVDLIERLNDGEVHIVADLLALLDKGWSDKVGLYLLSEIHLYRGLVKRQEAAA
ncbi:hypothetical protein LNV09_03255 [Paucibacter sp. B2R-40]|uniref:cupin domain-containing protein n=1 Tax=Paucibacter sp. B2R-40 TaxID=2893554 RepID=UPI0021E47573|nr:cupin domain-containing protein [Paucibacter sp. B2R-40]MCV2353173.1 hypothetical protein [Paucibacter sp. B2R-40]